MLYLYLTEGTKESRGPHGEISTKGYFIGSMELPSRFVGTNMVMTSLGDEKCADMRVVRDRLLGEFYEPRDVDGGQTYFPVARHEKEADLGVVPLPFFTLSANENLVQMLETTRDQALRDFAPINGYKGNPIFVFLRGGALAYEQPDPTRATWKRIPVFDAMGYDRSRVAKTVQDALGVEDVFCVDLFNKPSIKTTTTQTPTTK